MVEAAQRRRTDVEDDTPVARDGHGVARTGTLPSGQDLGSDQRDCFIAPTGAWTGMLILE